MPFPNNPNPGDSYTDAYGTVWIYAGSVNGWYRKTVIPGNETTYTGGGSGSATATGAAGEIQFTDGTNLAASPNLLWDDANDELEVTGDLKLLDGGTYTTTLQTITPTANRTISLPNATGTVALVGGSSGQAIYNNAGALAGISTMTFDGTSVTLAGRLINSYTSTSLAPAEVFTGTWVTGQGTTNTKPHLLIEPTGTTSTAWSNSGTGIGVNAASGFAGNLLDLQVNGTSRVIAEANGSLIAKGTFTDTTGNRRGIWLNALTSDDTNKYGLCKLSGGNEPFGLWATNQMCLVANGSSGVFVRDTAYYGWSSGSISASNTLDLTIHRDAANTLAQRRTTNAQTFRCYGTYTDASNYVRAALSSTSTAVTLAAETAGTGADDIPLNLTAAGTGTVKVNSVAEVVVSSTVAGLPAAPAVGMLTRVTDATAPAVGSTVAGGGAAAALVWYNGTNWTVIGV